MSIRFLVSETYVIFLTCVACPLISLGIIHNAPGNFGHSFHAAFWCKRHVCNSHSFTTFVPFDLHSIHPFIPNNSILINRIFEYQFGNMCFHRRKSVLYSATFVHHTSVIVHVRTHTYKRKIPLVVIPNAVSSPQMYFYHSNEHHRHMRLTLEKSH